MPHRKRSRCHGVWLRPGPSVWWPQSPRLVLPPYSAGGAPDIFDGLDRFEWDFSLIGKDLALLVGNRLAVDGERILRVVADPVKRPLAAAIPGVERVNSATTTRFPREVCRTTPCRCRSGEGGIVLTRSPADSTVTVAVPPATVKLTFTVTGTTDRTSTSCAY